jgi:hypothetical protein
MRKDRNDYRSMDTRQLQEETRYAVSPDWQELAIALAERLDTIRRDTLDEVNNTCDCY